MLAFCIQRGGGLYVSGTATLTNTNVYENFAAQVHLHFESSIVDPSSSAPLERYTLLPYGSAANMAIVGG